MNKLLGDYDKSLFWINAFALVAICGMAVFFTDQFGAFWNSIQSLLTSNFGWFYTFVVVAALIFCFGLSFSKYGSLKLGKESDKPEYSTFTWVAMLFSAGIGVGVYFWGAAEPLTHYMKTPYLAQAATPEAIPQAMAITFLHWGIHGWALYVVVGLGIAIAAYRLNKPLSLSSALYGLLGDRIKGPWGRAVDFICAFATVAGLSTSIGMGVLSLSYGVAKLLGIQSSIWINLAVMVAIFIFYTFSTIAGIEKGMARISTLNVYLCFGVAIFVFVFGPSRFLMNLFFDSMGQYIQYMPFMTFWNDSVGQTGWLGWWTTFYWAWWLAFIPFVSGFLARISKGRTVRQLLLGGMFFPSLIMYVWFNIMGGTAINLETTGVLNLWGAVQASTESGYYLMLEAFPFTTLISVIVLINLLTFLVTSADAGSIYVSVLMSKGSAKTTLGMRFICAILIAALPIALIAGGGLKALQTMSIVVAFPFGIITLLVMFSTIKMCKLDATFTNDSIKVEEVTIENVKP